MRYHYRYVSSASRNKKICLQAMFHVDGFPSERRANLYINFSCCGWNAMNKSTRRWIEMTRNSGRSFHYFQWDKKKLDSLILKHQCDPSTRALNQIYDNFAINSQFKKLSQASHRYTHPSRSFVYVKLSTKSALDLQKARTVTGGESRAVAFKSPSFGVKKTVLECLDRHESNVCSCASLLYALCFMFLVFFPSTILSASTCTKSAFDSFHKYLLTGSFEHGVRCQEWIKHTSMSVCSMNCFCDNLRVEPSKWDMEWNLNSSPRSLLS